MHACATGFLHDIKNLLTDTKRIEEHSRRTEVHAVCADKQTVRGDTRELVHHDSYDLSAARDFDAGGFLDDHTEAVVVIVCREVVETVHVMESLGICQRFAEFFDAAMDISHVDIDFLDGLAVDSRAETEDAVSRGVLRADIDDKIAGMEDFDLFFLDCAVGKFYICVCKIALAFVFSRNRVERRIIVVVFAEREAFPVDAEEKAAHIGIADEYDAEEVIDFAFIKTAHTPQVGDRVQHRFFAVRCLHRHGNNLIVFGRHQVIDASESIFPVHADDCDEIVHADVFVVAESLGGLMPLSVGDFDFNDAVCGFSRLREQLGNLVV